jgi:hypothetical protein
MELNPYARFLRTQDPIEVLQTTWVRIAKLSDRLPEDQFALRPVTSPPVPGSWNAREIVSHLADCELVFAFRLRQTLAEDSPTIQPFDQDRWAAHYGNTDFDNALRLFSALRDWNLLLLDEATPADLERPLTHPERGTMTFRTILETMAGHDLTHLQPLERLATLPA